MKIKSHLYFYLGILALLAFGCGTQPSASTNAQPPLSTSSAIATASPSQDKAVKPLVESAGFGSFKLVRTCYPPLDKDRRTLLTDWSNSFTSKLYPSMSDYAAAGWIIHLDLEEGHQIRISIERPGFNQTGVGLAMLPDSYTPQDIAENSGAAAAGIAQTIKRIMQGEPAPQEPQIFKV